MTTAKLQSFLKHIDKASKIANEFELKLPNGAFVDSLLAGIANDVEMAKERREA